MSEEVVKEVVKEEIKEEVKKDDGETLVPYSGTMLPKKIVDGFNKRVASEKASLQKNYDALSEQFNTLSTQLEEMKLSQMTDKERKELEETKRQKEIETLKQEKEQGFSLFKNYKTDTEIFNEVSNYDVFNPKQVVSLLKTMYKMDFIKDDAGDYNILFKVGDSQVTVKEAVKMFLEDESNSNLLRSTLKGGAGTKTKINQPNQTLRTTFKRSEIADQTSEASKEYREAMRLGLNPKIIEN